MSDRYTLAQFGRDSRRDIDAYLGYSGEYHVVRPGLRARISALLTPSVIACVLYRASRLAWTHRLRRLAIAIAALNLRATRATLHPASRIGGGLYIPHPGTGIVFQGEAGVDLKLFAGSAASALPMRPFPCYDEDRAPRLGDCVSLGSRSLVLGPVNVGSNAKIGFNACVTRDIPAGAVVVARHRKMAIARRDTIA